MRAGVAPMPVKVQSPSSRRTGWAETAPASSAAPERAIAGYRQNPTAPKASAKAGWRSRPRLDQPVPRRWKIVQIPVADGVVFPAQSFPGHGHAKPDQLEIIQLRREVAKLKAERDFLKKAVAYFAREAR